MASLSIVYWRDIPSQVIVKAGPKVGQARAAGAVHQRDRRGGDARGRGLDRRLPRRLAAGRAGRLRRRHRSRGGRRSRASRCAIRPGATGPADREPGSRRRAMSAPLTPSAAVARRALTFHKIVFAPSGRRGDVADGQSLLEAARSLGVDLELGLRRARHLRPLPGRRRRGRLLEASDRLRLRPRERLERRRTALRRQARPFAGGPPPRLPGARLRRPRRRRAAGKPGASPGRPQTRRDPPDRRRSGGPAALRRSGRARHARSDQRLPTRAGGARRAMGARRDDGEPARPARPPEVPAGGRLEGDGRRAQGTGDRRDPSRLRRPSVRRRDRHRLDDDRRPSLRSRKRRSAGLRGLDESADPLRRGSDEPGLLRDDESGRRRGADLERARGGRPPRRRSRANSRRSRAARSARSRSSAIRSCTTCSSGSIRPSSAGRLSPWRWTAGTKRARASWGSRSPQAASSMRCPASRATSARTRPASRWPRGPICATN